MKTTLVFAAIVGLTFGAPADISSDFKEADIQRVERSWSPCAAAGGYSGGGYSGAGGFAPAPLYQPQAPLAPLAPPQGPPQQYRENEKHQETSHGRSYYEPSLPSLPTGGFSSGSGSVVGPAPVAAPAAPAPVPAAAHSAYNSAVGVFPNAKVGGCNVPLLLSCSPQVVTGHIAESHYSAPTYRHAEEPKRETRNSEAKVASHHKVSEDYPEPQDPHPGNHHTVSKDYPEPNLTVYTAVQPQSPEIKKESKKTIE